MEDLGPLPVQNPRERKHGAARVELGVFLDSWLERNGLTSAEYLLILSDYTTAYLHRLVTIERGKRREEDYISVPEKL